MRIKLGRRQRVRFHGLTGRTTCGCVYYEGSLWAPCDKHMDKPAEPEGKHRRD